MIQLDAALNILDDKLADRHLPSEDVPVEDACGRILAEPAVSRVDLPPFRKSAMDGYAVMDQDKHDTYRVLEQIPAGKTPSVPLEPGSCSMVMTGAPVPENTGRVIIFEDTDRAIDVVTVNHHDERLNVCEQGEDVRIGQEILSKGKVIGAREIANLISCGISKVTVVRRVRVAIITTGDEIVASFEDLAQGKIIDSNGPMLAALATEQCFDIIFRKRVSDNQEPLTAAIKEGSDLADILLINGGVSAGEFDFVPEAMKAAGFEIHFDRVAVKPGKPITFATKENSVAFGLPGNPVSTFMGFQLFVRRAANLLCGRDQQIKSFKVTLGETIQRKRVGRTSFHPCIIDSDGVAFPIQYHGSAHMLALSEADGFVSIPTGVKEIEPGEMVLFYPIRM